MLLAIDTATEFAGLALYSPEAIWAEDVWYAARNHSVTLMPRLHRMLVTVNVKIADLEAVVVSLGPGSYTGVRVAAAIAKGLALPFQLPVIGIPTLDVTAYPFRHHPNLVVVVAQAGRKRILSAQYGQTEAGWQQLVPPAIFTIADLVASLDKEILLTGELRPEELKFVQEIQGKSIQIADVCDRVRRPSILAHLGHQKFAEAEGGHLSQVEPIYLNDP